jgi:Sulfotransferase family
MAKLMLDSVCPIIFIVGAPRTGSTILYQVVTNTFRVMFPDNLASLFGMWLPYGMAYSHLLFGDAPHNCFSSVRGKTWLGGLHAPSESEKFFRAIFTDEQTVNNQKFCQFTAALQRLREKHRQSVIFKSLRVGQHIRYIVRMVPSARFIHIRRDPRYAAQSILLARAEERADPNRPWYVSPRRHNELLQLHGVLQATRQVYLIDMEITTDLKILASTHQSITIWYSDLCLETDTTLRRLAAFLNHPPERLVSSRPRLAYNEHRRIGCHEFAELERYVEHLDWTFEESV